MTDKEINRIEQLALGAPEATQSRAETVESVPSAAPETSVSPEQISERIPVAQPVAISSAPIQPVVAKKDALTQEIEEILSEDLGDLYKQLPAAQKEKFREEGEKAAGLIKQMMEKGKLHTRRVLGLIRRWLQLIPGVNRFFLEQESKIKTDRLLMMEEEQKQKR